MFDITTLSYPITITLLIGMWALVNRLTRDASAEDLARMFGTPWDPAWPRGVQEDEPFHWHVELLDRGAGEVRPEPLLVLPACDECAHEAAA
jgi:hypothetical protein